MDRLEELHITQVVGDLAVAKLLLDVHPDTVTFFQEEHRVLLKLLRLGELSDIEIQHVVHQVQQCIEFITLITDLEVSPSLKVAA